MEVGLTPNTDFNQGLGATESSWGDPRRLRRPHSIPGLYAAGDVTDVPEKQIIIAAGDGAKAALGLTPIWSDCP